MQFVAQYHRPPYGLKQFPQTDKPNGINSELGGTQVRRLNRQDHLVLSAGLIV